MSRFQLPETLPGTVAELDVLSEMARSEIHDLLRASTAWDLDGATEWQLDDIAESVDRLEYLVASFNTIDAELAQIAAHEARVTAALTAAAAATAPKPEPPPKVSLELAVHEAAHAVVAAVYDAHVLEAAAWPEPRMVNGSLWHGKCAFGQLGIMASQHKHLIEAAGAVGAAVVKHGPNVSTAQIHELLAKGKGAKGSDYEKLKQHQHRSLLAGINTEGPREVLPLVLRTWPVICKVALRIQDGEEVNQTHIAAALGLSSDPALHPFELANLRAGLTQPAA